MNNFEFGQNKVIDEARQGEAITVQQTGKSNGKKLYLEIMAVK